MASSADPDAVKALRVRHWKLVTAVLVVVVLGGIAWAAGDLRGDTLFVLAVAPSLYLLWHFHHADKYKSESGGLLLGTFALGGFLAFVAAFLEPDLPKHAGVGVTFLYFLFSVGLVEELAKFVAVRTFAYRSTHFDETMDGVIFGITAAVGFATVENISYVFSYGPGTALFRAFVSVPGHAFYGAIMGYYLAAAKLRHNAWLAIWGLAMAVFLHAAFDTLATISGALAIVTLPALVWLIYFTIVKKEIALAQSESLYGPSTPG